MHYLLEIPEYNPNAFRPEAGRMKLYGKSDPPPPPDYAAQAQATAAGNLEAARYQTQANRVNQYTPYGSLEYTQDPTNPDRWTQTQTLTPTAQATLDKQLQLSDLYADTASTGFGRVQELLSNPQLDMSQLPDRAIDVGQTAQQAIMSRLQPQLEQSEEQLRARLANQGIGLGSTAYGREQNMAGQRRNDLELQAALQGINLDQANRASALQEQAYVQDRPLNLINALRTGAQVQSPQFQNFAQQGMTQGADLMGASSQQYGNLLDITNAQNANSANMATGLMGAGGAALAAYLAPAAMMF